MHRIDGPGATVDNMFTVGNPATGVPATVVTPDWLNAVQEEVAFVITEGGYTLNKADNTQLQTSIAAQIAAATGGPGVPNATTLIVGITRYGTDSEHIAGVETAAAATPAGITALFGAASQHVLAGLGRQKFPAGLEFRWGEASISNASSAAGSQATAAVTFLTPFPNACFIVLAGNGDAIGIGTENLEHTVAATAPGVNGFTLAIQRISGAHTASDGLKVPWFAIGW